MRGDDPYFREGFHFVRSWEIEHDRRDIADAAGGFQERRESNRVMHGRGHQQKARGIFQCFGHAKTPSVATVAEEAGENVTRRITKSLM